MAVFVLTQVNGPNYDVARPRREQAAWPEHAAFMDDLLAGGFVIMGGPLQDDQHVLLILEAADEQEVTSRLVAHRDRLQPQVAYQVVDHQGAVDRAAAEQVDRDHALLWPGMNAEMRLCENQHERDRAVRKDRVRGIEHVTGARGDRRHGDIGQLIKIVNWRAWRADGVDGEQDLRRRRLVPPQLGVPAGRFDDGHDVAGYRRTARGRPGRGGQ